MSSIIKLSSPAAGLRGEATASAAQARGFWEIPVLFEDAYLLVLDKPADLRLSPDRYDPDPARPNLMRLLHEGIAAGKPWARERNLTYLCHAYRLDAECSGVLLLAKSKAVLVALADLFGSGKSVRQFLALVQGTPAQERFAVNARLAPHPTQPGMSRVDPRGQRAETVFEVAERFTHHTLLRCLPRTARPHQIRVHLQNSGLRLVGDALYGGQPLLLSRLKRDYRLKAGCVERPLMARVALHAEALTLPHPVTGETLNLTAPWPKDLRVTVKYLREFAKA